MTFFVEVYVQRRLVACHYAQNTEKTHGPALGSRVAEGATVLKGCCLIHLIRTFVDDLSTSLRIPPLQY
jgi:hypothetical protein